MILESLTSKGKGGMMKVVWWSDDISAMITCHREINEIPDNSEKDWMG